MLINYTTDDVRKQSILTQASLDAIHKEITTSITLQNYTNDYTELLKNQVSKKELNEAKRRTGYITVSHYAQNVRSKGDVISASFIFLDIDNVDKNVYDKLFYELTLLSYTTLIYRSPSGNIKVVIELSHPITEDILYSELYKYIVDLVKQELPEFSDSVKYDLQGGDMARISFLSYDDKAYLNTNAIFDVPTHAINIKNIVEKRRNERKTEIVEINTFIQEIPHKEHLAAVFEHFIPMYANKVFADTEHEEHRKIWLESIQGLTTLGADGRIVAHAFNRNEYYEDSAEETDAVFEYELEATNNRVNNGKSVITFKSLIFNMDKVLGISIIDKVNERAWGLDITQYDNIFFNISPKNVVSIDNYQLGLYLAKHNIYSVESHIVIVKDNIAYLYDTKSEFSKIRDYIVNTVLKMFLTPTSLYASLLLRALHGASGILLNPSRTFTLLHHAEPYKFYNPKGSTFLIQDKLITLTPELKVEPISTITNGFIWEKHILPYNIDIDRLKKYIDTKAPIGNIAFNKFLILAHGENYESLITKLGEMLSLYRGKINKLLALYDAGFGDGGDGGGGKSLTIEFLGKFRKMLTIDKNTMMNEAKWMFSTLTPDTEIINFNDVPEHFPYEILYPLADETMNISTKGQGIRLLVKTDIPKAALSTNYLPQNQSNALKRRLHESILTSYFRDKSKERRDAKLDDSIAVELEIGRRLFDDNEDWTSLFYLVYYMIKQFEEFGVQQSINSMYLSKLQDELTDATVHSEIDYYLKNIAKETKEGAKILFKPTFDKYIEDKLSSRDKWELRKIKRNWLSHIEIYCGVNGHKMQGDKAMTIRQDGLINKGMYIYMSTEESYDDNGNILDNTDVPF